MVLRTSLPTGCQVIGYADDTLVLARGDTWQDAITTANHAVTCITRKIKRVGLKVAPEKTEATFYHDGTLGKPPVASQVIVEGTKIQIGSSVIFYVSGVISRCNISDCSSTVLGDLEKGVSRLDT